MSVTTLTSVEFSAETARATRAAESGPVIITDHGQPAHVLLTIEAYRRRTGGGDGRSIVDMLAMPDGEDIEFDPPKLQGPLWRPADLS